MEPLRRTSVGSGPDLRTERQMLDIIYILGGVGIFVVLAAYVHGLRRI